MNLDNNNNLSKFLYKNNFTKKKLDKNEIGAKKNEYCEENKSKDK